MMKNRASINVNPEGFIYAALLTVGYSVFYSPAAAQPLMETSPVEIQAEKKINQESSPKQKEKKETKEETPVNGGLTEEELRELRRLLEKSRTGVKTPSQPGVDKEETEDHSYQLNIFNQDLKKKKEIAERIQWQLTFFSSYNYFNNADLRTLNETNKASIEKSDDRKQFALAGAELDVFTPLHPRLDFRTSIWKTGFYGHDQLAGRDNVNDPRLNFQGSNTVNFGYLYIDFHLVTRPAFIKKADIRVGRQYFATGGAIDKDYYFDSMTDSIVFSLNSKAGKLDLLLVDLFGSGSNTKDINFVRYVAFDYDKFDYMDGRVNTTRHGAVYSYTLWGNVNDPTASFLDGRAFWFLATIGGSNQGGADRCHHGTACNRIDNDYTIMQGARISYGFRGYFRISVSAAESFGVDRKVLDLDLRNRDVDTDGKAYSAEGELAFFKRRIIIAPSYFTAKGGEYYHDGVQRSHGFVSMKAKYVGGLLADRYYGMRPSAHLENVGVKDEPYQAKRTAGTEVLHGGLSLGILKDLYFKADWWRYKDRNRMDYLTNVPAGYFRDYVADYLSKETPDSATVIKAARRFGNPIAEEINAGFEWEINEYFQIWAVGGVFRPMSYFSTPGLVATAPQGSAVFRGFQTGFRLRY